MQYHSLKRNENILLTKQLNSKMKIQNIFMYAPLLCPKEALVLLAIINIRLSGECKLLQVTTVSTDLCMCVCVSLPQLSLELREYNSVLCK